MSVEVCDTVQENMQGSCIIGKAIQFSASQDSVDLEATRFPVLLVGRRICNVYDKEGECEGECGGVRGDGHGQAIDAKVSVVPDAELCIVSMACVRVVQ
jgi:hypothetical protein